MVDIFTNPLGLDKLRHFSDMLGLQHFDMPHLRGELMREEQKEADRGAEKKTSQSQPNTRREPKKKMNRRQVIHIMEMI